MDVDREEGSVRESQRMAWNTHRASSRPCRHRPTATLFTTVVSNSISDTDERTDGRREAYIQTPVKYDTIGQIERCDWFGVGRSRPPRLRCKVVNKVCLTVHFVPISTFILVFVDDDSRTASTRRVSSFTCRCHGTL